MGDDVSEEMRGTDLKDEGRVNLAAPSRKGAVPQHGRGGE